MPRTVRSGPRRVPLFLMVAALACDTSPYREVHVDLGSEGATPTGRESAPQLRPLRVAVAAMLSPRSTYAAYSALFTRVGQTLGLPVDLVQRTTYAEVNELLLGGGLDAALVCTGGYLDLRRRAGDTVQVLAVPVVGGKTTYESVVIVPATSPAARLEDLRGKRFAFTDPLSLSGRAYVISALRQRNEGPHGFFAETIFTHSHDRSIDAVASGLVDGASVDSLVFASTALGNPELAARLRVVDRSPPLGIMPIVAAPGLSRDLRERIREVLIYLHRDRAAASALQPTGIERFVPPPPGLYDAAEAVVEAAR